MVQFQVSNRAQGQRNDYPRLSPYSRTSSLRPRLPRVGSIASLVSALTFDGKPGQAQGTACGQPDGNWRAINS
jgi:hypothetical protein